MIMYEISDLLYLKVAKHLSDAIGKKEFYSGVVALVDGDVECRLCCTLIVSRSAENGPEDRVRITRLSPVWWEFNTMKGGVVIDNDFSFRTMLTYFY